MAHRPSLKRKATAKRSYHHGNLREALLQATSGLLEKRAAESLTLRDVAKAAGVSHTAPYHHFKNMEEILATLVERAFADLVADMEALPATTDSDRLTMAGGLYISFALRHPALFRLMFGPMLAKKGKHKGLRQAAQKAVRTISSFAGQYDKERAAVLAMTGWAMAHGLASLAIEGVFDTLEMPIPDRDQAIVEVARNFMVMTSRRPEPEPAPVLTRGTAGSAMARRFVSASDLMKLANALRALETEGEDAHRLATIRLRLLTGLPARKLAALRWSDVDFRKGVLRPRGARSKGKTISLEPVVLDILRQLPRDATSQEVFPTAPGNRRDREGEAAWHKVVTSAGLPGLRVEDASAAIARRRASYGAPLPESGLRDTAKQSAETAEGFSRLLSDLFRPAPSGAECD